MPTPPRSTGPVSQALPSQALPDLISDLAEAGLEDFRPSCEALCRKLAQVSLEEAPSLATALLSAMQTHFGFGGSVQHIRPLVELLEEWTASRDCIRPLSMELLRGILQEMLRNLHNCSWSRRPDLGEDGQKLLRKLNLASVMLLTGIARPKAYDLLLGIMLRDAEVGTSLALKCIRKVNKNLASSRSPEAEVEAVLGVLESYAKDLRATPNAPAAATQGVREIASAAQRLCPAAAAAWLAQRQLPGDPDSSLEELLGLRDDVEKENVGPPGPGCDDSICVDPQPEPGDFERPKAAIGDKASPLGLQPSRA